MTGCAQPDITAGRFLALAEAAETRRLTAQGKCTICEPQPWRTTPTFVCLRHAWPARAVD